MSPDSIKEKLKTITKETNETFMENFKSLTFERFLARVSISEYRENLIFKGGLCLKYYVETDRGTKDLDFLLKSLRANESEIKEVFEKVAGTELNDGYKFEEVVVKELNDDNKQYPGFNVAINVKLGNMKDKLSIDIGIGDAVDEFELGVTPIQYKGKPLIDSGGITLLAYPSEYIFSEKLQAIVKLKALNSRMKDYFDCYILINQNALDKGKTAEAIRTTFEKRESKIQAVEDYSSELQDMWGLFRKKISSSPEEIKEIIDLINEFLVEIELLES